MNVKSINFGEVQHGQHIMRNMIDVEEFLGEGHFDDLVFDCVYTENNRVVNRATIHIPNDAHFENGVYYVEQSDLYNYNDHQDLDLVSYILTTRAPVAA